MRTDGRNVEKVQPPIVRALIALTGSKAQLLRHSEKPWASVTFTGTRHRLLLGFVGDEGVLAGEDLIAVLPEHEFKLAGELIADVAICGVERVVCPQPRLTVELELLTVLHAEPVI